MKCSLSNISTNTDSMVKCSSSAKAGAACPSARALGLRPEHAGIVPGKRPWDAAKWPRSDRRIRLESIWRFFLESITNLKDHLHRKNFTSKQRTPYKGFVSGSWRRRELALSSPRIPTHKALPPRKSSKLLDLRCMVQRGKHTLMKNVHLMVARKIVLNILDTIKQMVKPMWSSKLLIS